MNERFRDLLGTAQDGRLYPSVILYGADETTRRDAALQIARVLLCERPDAERGCDPDAGDACGHCRRLLWPEKGAERFHPDLHVLERDLRTRTSVDATKAFARSAVAAPFEARGQVFVVAEADSLGAGAADALLKLLEEPPERSPRHFLLLAASRLDLSTTLRSRSLTLFLGNATTLDPQVVDTVTATLARSLDGYFEAPSALHLLTAASALQSIGGFEDPRAREPWEVAAAAVVAYLRDRPLHAGQRRALLALAQDLIEAPRLRLRAIPPQRVLEGLVSRRLG
ncbi:MAG: hypothetical protein AAGE94_18355 [Acidobacteriota bacterium]